MSKTQLEGDLIIVGRDKCESGIGIAHFSKSNLIYDGADDPSYLRTTTELRDDFTREEIEGMEVVVKRGEFYIEML